MRIVLLLSLFFAASIACAQQVFKCVQGEQVIYQSQPCGASQRTAKQWDATPDVNRSTKVEAPVNPGSEMHNIPQRRRPNPGRKGRVSIDPADARCASAKAKRESKLKAVGMNRTFDLLRKLDDMVHEACR